MTHSDPNKLVFPRRCGACGKKAVTPTKIARTQDVKHEGRLHTVHVSDLKVLKCGDCGEVLLTNDSDEQIADELRKQLCVLTPTEIRRSREKLGLTQRELAGHLGTAEETISRWENGLLIQSRAMDKLLRLYFEVPEARRQLVRQVHHSQLA